MTVTVIKLSKRTLRTNCNRCSVEADYYRGQVAENENKVLLDQGPLNEGLELAGKPVPYTTVHRCFRRDAGLDLITGEPVTGTPAFDDTPFDDGDPFGEALPQDKAVEAPATPVYVRGQNPLADAIRDVVGFDQVDESQVEAIAERVAARVIGERVFPTRTVVIREHSDEPTPDLGLTHTALADVINLLECGEHVMQVGPAGTGKSKLAEQAAIATGREFWSISLCPTSSVTELRGFINAGKDNANMTGWRHVIRTGGLALLDEGDNSHPQILAWANACLVPGSLVAFPDGDERVHENFRCILNANTYGQGLNRTYSRSKLDAATLDRFTMWDVDYDEALENACVAGTGADADIQERVLRYVRKLRKNVAAQGLNAVMGQRNSMGMARMLGSGNFTWDQAVIARARRGMEQAVWDKIAA